MVRERAGRLSRFGVGNAARTCILRELPTVPSHTLKGTHVGKPDTSDRIWFLHLLRAFAVLGVLYSHLVSGPWAQFEVHARYANVPPPDLSGLDSKWDNPLLVPYVYGPLAWPYHHGVDSGAAGVALFFLISGLLIPMALERHDIRGFLTSRVFRIYPVWVASLALAALWFFGYAALTQASAPAYTVVDWMRNAALVTDWAPGRPIINPVAWTLLIEWKFYLLCAGLAALGLLHRPVAIVGTVAALTALGIAGHHYLLANPYSGTFVQTAASVARDAPPFLCATFIGTCLYHRLDDRWSARTCTLAIGALSALMVVSFRYGTPDWDAGWVRIRSFVAAGILLAVFYVFRDRIPYSRLLNWIATISYPIYAVHYLIGVGVMFSVYSLLPIPVVAQAVSVAVTLVAATALHRWVERPANDFGKQLAAPQHRPQRAAKAPEPTR